MANKTPKEVLEILGAQQKLGQDLKIIYAQQDTQERAHEYVNVMQFLQLALADKLAGFNNPELKQAAKIFNQELPKLQTEAQAKTLEENNNFNNPMLFSHAHMDKKDPALKTENLDNPELSSNSNKSNNKPK